MSWMVLTGAVFLSVVVVASLFLAALHYADSIGALVGAVGLTITLGALGIVLPLVSGAMVASGSASTHWPTAEATIVESRVEVLRHHRRRGRDYDTYTARIRYTYSVGGSEHQHWRLAFAGEQGYPGLQYMTDEQRANAMVADHPLGARFPASISPDDADVAVLHAGVDSMEASKLGLGLGGLLTGLLSGLLLAANPRVWRLVLGTLDD